MWFRSFRSSTVNFDPATSLTSNGAINIVTRSGGNAITAAASTSIAIITWRLIPALRRDPGNPQSVLPSGASSVSARRADPQDRAFFFTSYERTRPARRGFGSAAHAEFAPLGGIFPSPFAGNHSTCASTCASSNHNVVRPLHARRQSARSRASDRSSLAFGWTRRINRRIKAWPALTSVLSAAHRERFALLVFSRHPLPIPPAASETVPDCLRAGCGPHDRSVSPECGARLRSAARVPSVAVGYQLTESLVWQNGNHRLRFRLRLGARDEHGAIDCRSRQQSCSGRRARFGRRRPTIALPASFTTVDDILQLPLRASRSASAPGPFSGAISATHRVDRSLSSLCGDTWRAGRSLTVNYGLAGRTSRTRSTTTSPSRRC